ncbi:uncharacterized protein LOC133341916 [Lethenteron reissneri]|uniref:uncharacterized protein LOC133341916 n=1 Tax=Lethenteron reissneri TaxID=7753 RepID=UPI002AB610BA|nr:uncharacterized protein LOC133341916 [Lethenteron reissneri]
MAVYLLTLFIYLLQVNGLGASNLDTAISVEVGDRAWLPCGPDVGKEPGSVVWFKTTQGDSSPPVPVVVCSVDRALLLSCESDEGTSARHATYSCSRNHDLNIRNAEVSDSGTYRCAAAASLAEYSCKNATTMDDWNVLSHTWLEHNNQLSTSVRLTVMALVEKTYTIKVHTGDLLHAGTDSRVFIFINGSKNNLEAELLNSSCNCFEQNQIDFFTIKTKDLGCITEFNLSHNQRGLASDWYLDSIDVYEGHNHYKYELKEWVDGSRKIRLRLKDAREAQNCQVSASEGSRETSCLHGHEDIISRKFTRSETVCYINGPAKPAADMFCVYENM